MFAVVVLASAQGGKSLAPVLLKLLRQGETPIVFLLRDIDDPPSEIDNLQYTDQLYMPVTKLGYQSTLVTTGAKALEEMAQQNFAFVLIDCIMPEMDGFETARRIREAEKNKHYRHKLLQ